MLARLSESLVFYGTIWILNCDHTRVKQYQTLDNFVSYHKDELENFSTDRIAVAENAISKLKTWRKTDVDFLGLPLETDLPSRIYNQIQSS